VRPALVTDPGARQLAAVQTDFVALLTSFAATAIEQDKLAADEDPNQLAFELHSILLGVDTKFVLYHDPAYLELAREVLRWRLAPLSTREPRD